MDVCGLQRLGFDLADSRILIGNPLHLLLLDGRRGHVHSKDDILDLTLGQACYIDVVFLRIVGEDQVLELDLNVDPLLVGEGGPNMMRLSHDALVWGQYDLGSLWVQMECSQNEDQSAEAREALYRLLPAIVEIEK